MGVRDLLVLLGLLSAAVQTKQVSPMLSVSPLVEARCGQPVTLHCNVSSSNDNLSIQHLSWVDPNNKTLCWHDKLNQTHGVNCSYADQSLTLQFLHTPLQENQSLHKYLCKLRSSTGKASKYTRVNLKECCQDVKVAVTTEGQATCKFTGVYPDGDVHWFNGDTRLEKTKVKKSVDELGYLSIISSLPVNHTGGSYNCCLWHAKCTTYTGCAPILSRSIINVEPVADPHSGSAMLEGSIWRFFIISVLLMTL